MSDSWYEVWADEGLPYPYLVLVLSVRDGGAIVFDPRENKVIHQAASYEAVKLWLLEDEYTLVSGRMTLETP